MGIGTFEHWLIDVSVCFFLFNLFSECFNTFNRFVLLLQYVWAIRMSDTCERYVWAICLSDGWYHRWVKEIFHAVSAVLLLVYRVYRCSIVVLSSVYLIIGLSFLLSSVLSVVLFVRLVLIETLLSLDHLWVRIVD